MRVAMRNTRAYYNEDDPRAAAWLRELIREGHIAPGDVDERSIEDVIPNELKGYRQCHFFAGIGGWSYALRLAGWPDDKPVWTGSCPCQPFSAAGKGKGFADERHLWPPFGYLIWNVRPAVVFGEQVARKSGYGWLDLVSHDLERAGYAFGAANLAAASVGAPHIRQRVYWVAHDHHLGREQHAQRDGKQIAGREESAWWGDAGRCSVMGDALGTRAGGYPGATSGTQGGVRRERNPDGGNGGDSSESTGTVGVADPRRERLEIEREQQTRTERQTVERSGAVGFCRACGASIPHRFGEGRCASCAHYDTDPWRRCEWIPCRDGKSRPVEPGSFPLAHGIPGRVGLLRGYGNAIVPQVAAAFIEATGLIGN